MSSTERTDKMAKTGRLSGSTRALVRFVGSSIQTKNQIIAALAVLDKPIATWESEYLDKLYRDLRAMLEIEERFRALEYKLRTIQESLELFLDLVRHPAGAVPRGDDRVPDRPRDRARAVQGRMMVPPSGKPFDVDVDHPGAQRAARDRPRRRACADALRAPHRGGGQRLRRRHRPRRRGRGRVGGGEPRLGYGAACLRGVAHLSVLPRPPDAVVFMAADGSDDPTEIPAILGPLRENLFDLVIGSRVLGKDRLGSSQKAGNLVAVNLIRAIYGHKYTDLGPFRAIRYPALVALGMRDGGHGWLVEMQVKALKVGLRIAETPVSYRPPAPRGGLGERVRETVGTGTKVLFQIFRHSTAR